jgi:hypothetical protein
MKDENGYLLADSDNVLNRWKKICSQLLGVHRISDVRQIGIHTAEPLISERALLILKLLMQTCKSINFQVLIKFWQN